MLVDFPLYGFDMTPHLARTGVQTQSATLPNQGNGGGVGIGWSPWKKPRTRQTNVLKYDENIYDLYAICNHHGQDLQVRTRGKNVHECLK